MSNMSSESTEPGFIARRRGALVLAAKVVVGAALLALLLRQIGWQEVKTLLARTDLAQFALACCWLALSLAAQSVRWMAVMAGLEAPITPRTAFVGTFESMLFNQVLPSSVGGDAWRALRAYDAGLTPQGAVVGVLIDRAFGLLSVGLVALVGWTVGGTPVASTPAFVAVAVAATCIVGGAGIAVIVAPHVSRASVPAWAGWTVALVHGFASIMRMRRPLLLLAISMASFTLLSGLALKASAAALGIPLDLWSAMVALQGMLLASVIPVSIGGWGLREGAAVLLLAGTGLGAVEATAIAILFGLAATVMGIAGAGVWMLNGYQRVDPAKGLAALRPGGRDPRARP
jgi:hypothetical protein